MKNKAPMTAVILAGGKSSRMGCDKALLRLGEKTILEDLVELTASIFSETFILTSPSKNYQPLRLKRAVILNDFWENRGPLAGLYTGLSYSTYPASCVLTCDMPLVDGNLLQELAADWQDSDDAVCPMDFDGRRQPFPGIYSRDSRHLIRLLLDRGETSMRQLLDVLTIRPVMLNKRNSEVLANMNTPQDYQQIAGQKREADRDIPSIIAS